MGASWVVLEGNYLILRGYLIQVVYTPHAGGIMAPHYLSPALVQT